MPYWRLSGIYFFYFALLGAIIPFWNLYLLELGYSAADIGYLGAILMGTKVVSPYLLGWLTDRTGRPVRIIRWSNFLALLLFSGIFLFSPDEAEANRFLYLALVVAGFSFFWNAVIAQYEALTFMYLGQHFQRYGPIRAWGSVGFIVAVTALGYLFEQASIRQLPLLILLMLLSIWLSSLYVREVPATTTEIKRNSNKHATLADMLLRKDVIGFFAGCFLIKFAHGPYYTFYSIYLDAYGYSKATIGSLWALGVIAELMLFFVVGRFLSRYGIRTILAFAAVAGAVRWLAIGLFPESLWILIVCQLLHAATFAGYHAAAVEWVRRVFNGEFQGQGQALYSAASFGAGSAVGAFVSGMIWTDALSVYWFYARVMAALISAVAVVMFWYSSTHHRLPK